MSVLKEVYVVCSIYSDTDSDIAVYRNYDNAVVEFYRRLGEHFYDAALAGKADFKDQYENAVELSNITLEDVNKDNEHYIYFDDCELYIKRASIED